MSGRAKFEVSIDEQSLEVAVAPPHEGLAQVGDSSWELKALGQGEYLARKRGSSTQYRVWVDPSSDQVSLGGHARSAKVRSTRDLALLEALEASGAGAGTGVVASPMPGRVVAILVNEGQSVRAKEPVAIVEAMKMENELHAPIDGVVKSVRAKAEDAVEAGHVLCEIVPPA